MILLYEIPIDDFEKQKAIKAQIYIEADHSLTRDELVRALSKMDMAERIKIDNPSDNATIYHQCMEVVKEKLYFDYEKYFPIVSEKRPIAEVRCITAFGGSLEEETGIDEREMFRVNLIQPYKYFE